MEHGKELRDRLTYAFDGPITVRKNESIEVHIPSAVAQVRLVYCFYREWKNKSLCVIAMVAMSAYGALENGQAHIAFADGFVESLWVYPAKPGRESQVLVSFDTAVLVSSSERLCKDGGDDDCAGEKKESDIDACFVTYGGRAGQETVCHSEMHIEHYVLRVEKGAIQSYTGDILMYGGRD